eukprot:Nk52_evm3s303 gene=Nk52_evmTU3s303
MYGTCPDTDVLIVKEEDIDRIEQMQINKIAYTGKDHKPVRMNPCRDFSPDEKQKLQSFEFAMWEYTENELLHLLKIMFEELGFMELFKIEEECLSYFLSYVRENYNENPYHNFLHSFAVTQMMYSVITQGGLREVEGITNEDIFVLLVSCICHDLDHPGVNNAFMVKAKTELAERYNDVSCLEKHHSTVAMDILSRPDCNIMKNVEEGARKRLRKGIVTMILATDMAFHGQFIQSLKDILERGFDLQNMVHKTLAMQLLVKACDISNEVRPLDVEKKWVDCLLNEFFHQGDMEKERGWEPIPLLDREKVERNSSQKGFIGFVSLPLFEVLSKCFTKFSECFVKALREKLEYYSRVVEDMEREKKGEDYQEKEKEGS